MEVSYKKDLEKSYMLIKTQNIDEEDYKVKMLCNNSIPGIIPISLRVFNNNIYVYYDISGKISLTGKYSGIKIKANDIKVLMYEMQKVIESAKEYMLDVNKIILDMDFIFETQNNKGIAFCYYPEKKESFVDSLHLMLNKIIEMADHADRETVIISYGLQKMTQEENVTINEMLTFLGEQYKERNEEKVHGCKIEANIESGWEKESLNEEMKDITINTKEDNLRKKSMPYKDKNKKESKFAGGILKGDLFEKLKQTIRRKKKTYESMEEMELSDNREICVDDYHEFYQEPYKETYRETYQRDCQQNYQENNVENFSDIEETVMLKTVLANTGVVLKCSDIERAQTIIPNEFPCIIGKSKKSSDCIIEDKTISRVHLRINEEEDGYYIEDLNSTNGTYLNGERIKPHQLEKINIGDIIKLSEIEYVVC